MSEVEGVNASSVDDYDRDAPAYFMPRNIINGDILLDADAQRREEAIQRLVWAQDVSTIEAVLKEGLVDDLDVCDPMTGYTCLHNSAWYGRLDIIQFLLDHKPPASINKTDRHDGHTPLIRAVYNNQIEAVKLLLANKADKNCVTSRHNGNHKNSTALEIAKKLNNKILEHILSTYNPEQRKGLRATSAPTAAASEGVDSDINGADLPSQSPAKSSGPITSKMGKSSKSIDVRTAKKIAVLAVIVVLIAFIVQQIRRGD